MPSPSKSANRTAPMLPITPPGSDQSTAPSLTRTTCERPPTAVSTISRVPSASRSMTASTRARSSASVSHTTTSSGVFAISAPPIRNRTSEEPSPSTSAATYCSLPSEPPR